MIIDVKENRTTTVRPGGLTGFISYGRLVEQLRKAGELRPHETISHFELNSDGVKYVIVDREEGGQ